MKLSPVRTIAVTGATRGLGRALVEEFLRAGHRVLACGRSSDAIATLKAEASVEQLRASTVDVREAEAVRGWAQEALAAGFEPDLVIANAGLVNAPAPLWEVPPEEIADVMAVNVLGAANTVRAFAPAMIDRGQGVLALLSSGWGRSTAPEVAPYCASKWAVEGMAQSLSQELPRGVGIFAVNPGVIDTDMLRRCFGDAAASYEGPAAWSKIAAPFFLGLRPDSGSVSVTVQ